MFWTLTGGTLKKKVFHFSFWADEKGHSWSFTMAFPIHICPCSSFALILLDLFIFPLPADTVTWDHPSITTASSPFVYHHNIWLVSQQLLASLEMGVPQGLGFVVLDRLQFCCVPLRLGIHFRHRYPCALSRLSVSWTVSGVLMNTATATIHQPTVNAIWKLERLHMLRSQPGSAFECSQPQSLVLWGINANHPHDFHRSS